MLYAELSAFVATVMLIVKTYGDSHFPAIDPDTKSLVYALLAALLGVALAEAAFAANPAVLGDATNPQFQLIVLGVASSLPGGIGSSLLTLFSLSSSPPSAQEAAKPRRAIFWR